MYKSSAAAAAFDVHPHYVQVPFIEEFLERDFGNLVLLQQTYSSKGMFIRLLELRITYFLRLLDAILYFFLLLDENVGLGCTNEVRNRLCVPFLPW